MDRSRSRTYIATPPGATIREQLEDRGMSQKEFAARMAMSEKHISHLINGSVQLTPEVANRLEMVLDIPASFWNNLEAIYREKLAKVEEENQMDADIELAGKFPYKELVKNGWIIQEETKTGKVIALRKYFEVSRLDLTIADGVAPRIACRRHGTTEKADFALLAWAQQAKIQARKQQVAKVNLQLLEQQIPQIRKLTRTDPSVFCPELTRMLAECGVAIVFLPHINGSFLHGATFYDGNKIVIGLTVRGKDADRFWFSLFHEIGHILLGHINQANGTTVEDEKATDNFAEENLIHKEAFEQFVALGDFSKAAIISFAIRNEIDAGIVVGRLQKKGCITYAWHNALKKKYEIAIDA